jgi:hypothetical protein
MIAAYAVIFVLSLAAGWRGYKLIALWRLMHWKILAAAFVVWIIALTVAQSLDMLIALPLTYLMLWMIGGVAFGLGLVARLSFGRSWRGRAQT